MPEVEDFPDYQMITDTSAAGSTRQFVAKAGTVYANRDELIGKAQAALAANSTFLAIASPTQAQAVAQVQRLTKECNAIIRVLLNAYDSTADT